MACGIYSITRRSTGQMYIGKSVHIFRRFYEHYQYPNPTSRIDNAIKKYGKEDFELKIIKCCKPQYLNRFEKLYIRIYNTFNNNFHYNLTLGGDGFGYGEDNPSYKGFPTIRKGGFNNNKPMYTLCYNNKRLRSSPDKKKLQKYIDDGTWKKFYGRTDKEFLRMEKEKSKRFGEEHHNYREDIILEEILELLKIGFTPSDIATEKNISESTIRNRLRNEIDEEEYLKIKQRNMERLRKFNVENNNWIELDDKTFYEDYLNGLSFSRISKKHNVQHQTVKRHIEHYAKKNNLPLTIRERSIYRYKDYPRIIKAGTTENGQRNYRLKYKRKTIKESIDYNKLEEIINNPTRVEELYEECINRITKKEQDLERIKKQNEYIEKNNIKYFKVRKTRNSHSKTGFYWTYDFSENKTRHTLSSIDIKELEKKVIEKGWIWKEVKEEDKTKKIKKVRTREEINMGISKTKTNTGIYRVQKLIREDTDTGILWSYTFKGDGERINLTSIDLETLKQKVLLNKYPWVILDEEKAKKSFEFNNSLNIPSEKIRKNFTLWDSSKLKYRKSVFKKNKGLTPRGCFKLKFNNKEISCGTFIEFLSPMIIYDLINEN